MREVIRGIEILLDRYYYVYRERILYGFLFLFCIAAVCSFWYLQRKGNGKEDRQYLLNQLLHKVFYTLLAAFTGELLCLLGLQPQIQYIYWDALIFLFLAGMLTLYTVLQCIAFRRIVTPVFLFCKYMRYVLFFEVFLLAVTGRLERIEWAVGAAGIACLETAAALCERLAGRQETAAGKAYDRPTADLYETRRKQLDKFIGVLKEQQSEPYAVMISGEWGSGKTSFVTALEKKLSRDAFIWIRAGSEKSAAEIMAEISGQILDILRRSGVLVEKGSLIETYFMAFAGLLEETGFPFFNRLANAAQTAAGDEGKAYLNGRLQELEKTGKTIYLVVDDLDRCEREYQLKMFKVIRESADLKRCKTIFLADRSVFAHGAYDDGYIEKYISYTLELCSVGYAEITDAVLEEIISDDWLRELHPALLKGRSAEAVREMIRQFPGRVLELCESERTKTADGIKGRKEEEVRPQRESIRGMDDTLRQIRKNTANSRKVKNFLKGVRRDCQNLSSGIADCSPEFQKEDWLAAVIEVQFVKSMLPQMYTELKMSADLDAYLQKDASHCIGLLLGLRPKGWRTDRKEHLLNRICYEIDIIDFEQIKTKKERLLAELRGSKASMRYLCEYADCAQCYDDLEKILDLYETQRFASAAEKENFLRKIFDVLSQYYEPFAADGNFLAFSRELLSCIDSCGVTERELKICTEGGEKIIRKALTEKQRQLLDILYLVFGVSAVERSLHNTPVGELRQFYFRLRELDKNDTYHNQADQTDALCGVIAYYEKLEEELSREKYKSAGIDFARWFMELRVVFDICLFWDKAEQALGSGQEDCMPLFNRYFLLRQMNPVYGEIFRDVEQLRTALASLRLFYQSQEAQRDARAYLLLLQTANRMAVLYEDRKSWYGGREKEIADLLAETAKDVYTLYEAAEAEDAEVQKALDEIRVYVYRFRSYCGSDVDSRQDIE